MLLVLLYFIVYNVNVNIIESEGGYMELTTTEKIKLIKNRCNLTLGDLAERANTTRQNLNNKFNRNNFSEKEIRELGDVLGCDVEIIFINRETGERI